MKVIIAGGRDYTLKKKDYDKLREIPITEVVSGGARGADQDGETYAVNSGIPYTRFRADWHKHGKSAGPIRNRQMAEYADAVVLFPGGKGTLNMKEQAERLGLQIYNYME
jgi:predicted Rossmann-fold nucleotide-binding protein